MGCKVFADFCSICSDWDRILPLIDRPRDLLAENKRNPIRGMSTTTDSYCQHLKFELNKIYPDGRKVMMINRHPRFFDISFVFIGADRQSKMMAKLAGKCPIRENSPMCKNGCYDCSIPSHHVHEVWSRESMNKMAEEKSKRKIIIPASVVDAAVDIGAIGLKNLKGKSAIHELGKVVEFLPKVANNYGPDEMDINPADDEYLSQVFPSRASNMTKNSEIIKRIQSNFDHNTLPELEDWEPDLPLDLQDEMSDRMSDSLSTAGGLGIVAKPREFQRIYIRAIGKPDLADDLDSHGICFREGMPPSDDFSLSEEIIPRILEKIIPMMMARSSFGPPIHTRIIIIKKRPEIEPMMHHGPPMHEMGHELLDKVGSAYSAYRRDLIYKTASLVSKTIHEHPETISSIFSGVLPKGFGGGQIKMGSDIMESLISPFTTSYLNRAYMGSPVSKFVEDNNNLNGLIKARELFLG
jgi:hypothetical protein